MEAFANHGVKGTFFVLGFAAESAPHVVKAIANAGREIQSRGYGRLSNFELDESAFREDVTRAKKLLEDIAGCEIYAYRAPCFTIDERSMWVLDVLAETAEDLPQAEVLSIAVSSQARGKGIGKVLMKTAMDEFVRRGIKQVKVAVWAGNEVANKFYQRCGFSLATTREHHGLPMNIYVIDPARLRETSEC